MGNKINILITGCGGDIGQSIGKILNESDYVNNLYGRDISDKNAAQFIFSNFSTGLPCSHPDYIKGLEDFVANNAIDIVLPIAEPELRFFSRNNILENIGAAEADSCFSTSPEVGFDKLKTAEFLEQNGLPFPVSQPLENVSDMNEQKLPVILKARVGSGSSKVNVVRDMDEFTFLQKRSSAFVMQEYLEGDEYTCGVFRSKNGLIRNIILRRELMGGFSGYGEGDKE